MSLPCFFSPGLLLLTLLPYYYINKRAEFSLSNIAGAFGLAALLPVWSLTGPFIYILRARFFPEERSILKAKLKIPVAIGMFQSLPIHLFR